MPGSELARSEASVTQGRGRLLVKKLWNGSEYIDAYSQGLRKGSEGTIWLSPPCSLSACVLMRQP